MTEPSDKQLEKWVPAWKMPGFEVSSLGRLRSSAGKLVKPLVGRKGYNSYLVRIAGKTVSSRANRLILTSFIGGASFASAVAAHLNGKSGDDRLSNLQWKTQAENEADKHRHGTLHSGVYRPERFLMTYEKAEQARAEYQAGGVSQQKLADKYGVAGASMSKLLRDEKWVPPDRLPKLKALRPQRSDEEILEHYARKMRGDGKRVLQLANEGLASRKAGGASAAKDRHDLLMMLAARPDITGLFGFKEREIFEAARKRNNEAPDPPRLPDDGETEG